MLKIITGISEIFRSKLISPPDRLVIKDPKAFAQRAPNTSIHAFALYLMASLVGMYNNSFTGSLSEKVIAFKIDNNTVAVALHGVMTNVDDHASQRQGASYR